MLIIAVAAAVESFGLSEQPVQFHALELLWKVTEFLAPWEAMVAVFYYSKLIDSSSLLPAVAERQTCE
jgi:hypothetical protein